MKGLRISQKDILGYLLKKDLVKVCYQLEIETTGTRDELIARISRKRGTGPKDDPSDVLHIDDSLLDLVRYVAKWKPKRNCNREQDYTLNLLHFLNENGWYASTSCNGGHRADIFVNFQFPIEMKMDIGNKTDQDRVLGQLIGYKDHYRGFILVVTEPNDYDFTKSLVERIPPNIKKGSAMLIMKNGKFTVIRM